MTTATRETIEQAIPATTHGRYVVLPAACVPAPLVVGFHGYGEAADEQLERLRAVDGSEQWTLVAVQALHRFYLRASQNVVVASWMTRQDRELAIADNLAYVAAVVETEWAARQGARGVVFAGFSQGVAMAFRAAAASARPVAGVVAVCGDIPPELDRAALARVGPVLQCHGRRETWYSAEKFERDLSRLREAGNEVTPFEFDGGHRWSDEVAGAVSAFLRERFA